MGIDTAVAMAAIGLVLLWPLHQELTIRALRYSLGRQREQLAQHRRAIVQLQGAAVRPPTSVGQPMPTVGRPLAQGGIVRGPMGGREDGPELFIPGPTAAEATRALIAGARTMGVDLDPTLRLARPPALGDVEAAMAKASRALTPTELAARLDRQPWDLIADIDRLERAGRIVAVPSHTAGRTAYRLAEYRVHPRHVTNIRRRRTWKWL